LSSDLAILSEGQRPAVNIEHTGDAVSVGVVRQHGRLFTVVVEVTAVRTIQPHVGGRPMTVVPHRPLAHPDTRPLIATVLLHDLKLYQHNTLA